MTENDWKVKIKEIIQQHDGIRHVELLDKIVVEKNLMAKKTAEKYIGQLCEDKEIHFETVGKRKRYYLPGGENNQNKLNANLELHIDELKENIDKIAEKFPTYPYNIQCYVYDSVLKWKQDEIHHIEKQIKQIEKEEQDEICIQEFSDSKRQIIELMTNLEFRYWECKTTKPFNELMNLVPEKFKKISKLTKQVSQMKVSEERDIIRDEIKKLSSELNGLTSQMEKTIRSLQYFQEQDRTPFEFDEKIMRLHSMGTHLDHSRKNMQELQQTMNGFKLEETQQNKDFEEINLQITTMGEYLDSITKNIKKIEQDSILDDLYGDVHREMSQLIKVINNMAF